MVEDPPSAGPPALTAPPPPEDLEFDIVPPGFPQPIGGDSMLLPPPCPGCPCAVPPVVVGDPGPPGLPPPEPPGEMVLGVEDGDPPPPPGAVNPNAVES